MKRIIVAACVLLSLTSCGKVFKSKMTEPSSASSILAGMPDTKSEEMVNREEKEAAPTGYTSAGLVGSYDRAVSPQDESAQKNISLPTLPFPTTPQRVETKIPLKIIRNAHINFQVDSTDVSHAHITALLSLHQSYFGTDNRVQYDGQIQQNMVIRVPSEHFDALVEALMRESIYTNSKNITAEDVTAEFVDAEARLKSKKEVEKRYSELLVRARNVSEVIEVESNLRAIREEIEATEGRLKLLKDQVGHSTIDLTIYQKVNASGMPGTGMGYRILQAGVNGWRGAESFFVILVSVWPLLIAGVIIAAMIRVRLSRRSAKQLNLK